MSLLALFRKRDRYEQYAIAAIVVAVLVRIILASLYTVSGDSCWHIMHSKFIAEEKALPVFEQFGRDEPFWSAPLFHIISAAFYLIGLPFGTQVADFTIRITPILMGSLTLILLFGIGKTMFNRKIGFYAVLFLAFIPLHIDYSIFSYTGSTATFFITLSIYLLLRERLIFSALAAAAAILTKYNGLFVVPILLFILWEQNKKPKEFFRKAGIAALVAAPIGSLWFIRNWIYLNNPVWPFMNNVFGGYVAETFVESNIGSLMFSNFLNINGVFTFYLGFFGVPDGNIETLTFFSIPFLGILFPIWLLATLFFSGFIVLGMISKPKHRNILYVWIVSYLLVLVLFILNADWSASRFLMPMLPALALFWAHGIDSLKNPIVKKAALFLLSCILVGFAFTSFVKVILAAGAWEVYNDDFDWIQQNTAEDALVITGSQCISYHIDRMTAHPLLENIEKADYAWVNQDFSLDLTGIADEEFVEELEKNQELVYENEDTGTRFFRLD